jgi:hypothetical protein
MPHAIRADCEREKRPHAIALPDQAGWRDLCRLDQRQHATLTLLLQIQTVSNGHRHPNELHEARLAGNVVRECLDSCKTGREIVRWRALMQQLDQVRSDVFGGAPDLRRSSADWVRS